jgi:hypothetical protein
MEDREALHFQGIPEAAATTRTLDLLPIRQGLAERQRDPKVPDLQEL